MKEEAAGFVALTDYGNTCTADTAVNHISIGQPQDIGL